MLIDIVGTLYDSEKVYVVPVILKTRVFFRIARPEWDNFYNPAKGRWAAVYDESFKTKQEAVKFYEKVIKLKMLFSEFEVEELPNAITYH